jgi:hypothetical protein
VWKKKNQKKKVTDISGVISRSGGLGAQGVGNWLQ